MTRPRRYLLVTPKAPLSGAFLALTELAAALTAAGHTVDVSVTAPDSVDPRAPALLQQSGATLLGRAVEPSRYDAALVNGLTAYADLNALSGRLPTVFWIHEAQSGLNLVQKDAAAAMALATAHHLIFPHEHCRDTVFAPFLDKVPRHRISIIPTGVRAPDPTPDGGTKGDGVRDGVLFVGALDPRKRPQDLMRAGLGMLPSEVTLRFVGPTDHLTDETRRLADGAPGRIRLLGPLGPVETQAEYRRAAVFALPSDNESFGRAPLEAALNGCAVVVSDLPVYRGIWIDGKTALTHGVGDVTRLGVALRVLFDNSAYREALAAAGRRVALHYPAEEASLRVRLLLERLPEILR